MTIVTTALQVKTIGSLLAEKRKEKGLELSQVSDVIKIRSDYLKALEEGDYAKFPSEVYLKGFLKNYAKFLGIKVDKALALYRRENERKHNDSTINAVAKVKAKPFIMSFTPNRIIALIAVLAIILIVAYLATYVGKVVKIPDLKLTSPIALDIETEGAYKTDANFIELSGSAEIGSKLSINEQELKLNNFEKFSQEFKLEEGLNQFVIRAESQFGRAKVLTLNVSKEQSAQPTPTPTTTPVNMDVVIEIQKKDATVAVNIDGEQKTDRGYKVGSLLEFTAFSKIEISTNQPASLVVTINGEPQTLSSNDATWELIQDQVIRK